jgi:quercetin dioxygenase-like cupin family protein
MLGAIDIRSSEGGVTHPDPRNRGERRQSVAPAEKLPTATREIPGAPGHTAPSLKPLAGPGPIFEPIAQGVADVTHAVRYVTGPTTLDFRKATIPVLGEIPWHYHPGPTTFIVVQGELTTFSADGSSVVLRPGEADVEVVGQARMSQNLGTEEVVVYIAFAPPAGMEPTIWLSGPDEELLDSR